MKFRYIFFLVLQCTELGAARHWVQCNEGLLALASSQGYQYEVFRFPIGGRPGIHVRNYLDFFPEQREFHLPQVKTLVEGGLLGISPDVTLVVMKMRATSSNGTFIEARSMMGHRLFFKVKPGAKSSGLTLKVLAEPKGLFKSSSRSHHLAKDSQLRLIRPIAAEQKERWIAELTQTHLKANPEIPAEKMGLVAQAMVEQLIEGRPLTRGDLENWNSILEDYTKHPEVAGVTRGTKGVYLNDKTYVEVDLTAAEIAQTSTWNGIDWVSLYHPPAAKTPEAIDSVLDRVNTFDNKTPVRKILATGRNYWFLHQFADGNKRNARFLIDFLLLKSGYLPVPYRTGAPKRQFSYLTPDEYDDLMRSHYRRIP